MSSYYTKGGSEKKKKKVPIGIRTRAFCATNRRTNHYTIEMITIMGIKIFMIKQCYEYNGINYASTSYTGIFGLHLNVS